MVAKRRARNVPREIPARHRHDHRIGTNRADIGLDDPGASCCQVGDHVQGVAVAVQVQPDIRLPHVRGDRGVGGHPVVVQVPADHVLVELGQGVGDVAVAVQVGAHDPRGVVVCAPGVAGVQPEAQLDVVEPREIRGVEPRVRRVAAQQLAAPRRTGRTQAWDRTTRAP